GDGSHAAGPLLVPKILGEPDSLGEQLILGLEVVDDQCRAGPCPLGHVGDTTVGVPALIDDLKRPPPHLFPPLIGRAGVVRLHFHGSIFADGSDLGTCLLRFAAQCPVSGVPRPRRRTTGLCAAPLWTTVPVSRLNIQSNLVRPWQRGCGSKREVG